MIIYSIAIGLEKSSKLIEKQDLDAVHVTIVYHEDFDELAGPLLKAWDKHFKENSDLIFLGKNFKDIDRG